MKATLTHCWLLGVLTLLAGICSFWGSGPSMADNIREHIRGPFVYNGGNDMSLVNVRLFYSFWHRKERRNIVPPVGTEVDDWPWGMPLKMSIPRAFVTGCKPYSSRSKDPIFKVRSLPDDVACTEMVIDYYYPTASPYTGPEPDFDEIHKKKPLDIGFGQVFRSGSGKDVVNRSVRRALKMDVEIKLYGKDDGDVRSSGLWNPNQQLYKKLYKRSSLKYQGFTVLIDDFGGSGGRIYFDDGPDEIRIVRCPVAIEQSRIDYYCTAEVPVNDHIYVRMKFIDFRLNGGRAFLRERIKNFKKHFCRYLECDDTALRAAAITGGM